MVGTCTIHGRDEKYTNLWLGKLKGRDNLGDAEIDGRTILRWLFRNQDMKFWRLAKRLLPSQEGLCSKDHKWILSCAS
jgi:hypothetical protein